MFAYIICILYNSMQYIIYIYQIYTELHIELKYKCWCWSPKPPSAGHNWDPNAAEENYKRWIKYLKITEGIHKTTKAARTGGQIPAGTVKHWLLLFPSELAVRQQF